MKEIELTFKTRNGYVGNCSVVVCVSQGYVNRIELVGELAKLGHTNVVAIKFHT